MHSHNASVMSDQTTYQHPQGTHHLQKHENSLTLHLPSEYQFSLQKRWCNINTCFYKHLKTCLEMGSILHVQNNTPLVLATFWHILQPPSCTLCSNTFLCVEAATASTAEGWLPSVEKTALPEIQPKNAVSSTQKQQPLPKGRKKKPTKLFFKLQPRGTETYLAWKIQESLLSPAL